MDAPILIWPSEWNDEIEKIKQWYNGNGNIRLAHINAPALSGKSTRLSLALGQIAQAAGSCSIYCTKDAYKRDYIFETWGDRQIRVVDMPTVTTYSQFGKTMYHFREADKKLIIVEADPGLGINYMRALLHLAWTLSNLPDGHQIRVVWMATASMDPDLNKMVSVMVRKCFNVTAFSMPPLIDNDQLPLKDWKVYPFHDLKFLSEAAKAIASDYGVEDDENEQMTTPNVATRYKNTTTVIFWHQGMQSSGYEYPHWMLGAYLQKYAGREIQDLPMERLDCRHGINDGVVMYSAYDTTFAMPDSLQHVILCSTKFAKAFDKGTSHFIYMDRSLTAKEIEDQANAGRRTGAKSDGVTIHSQVSLRDTRGLKAPRQFEESHLHNFILHAVASYPTLDIHMLMDAFSHDDEAFEEIVRRLIALGCIKSTPTEHNPKDIVFQVTARGLKVAKMLSAVDENIHAAIFLSLIDRDTSVALRSAMVDIVAIIFSFESANPFLTPTQDEFSFSEEILNECRNVPKDVITTGTIWLALAVYRNVSRYCQEDTNIELEIGSLYVNASQCHQVKNRAVNINRKIDEILDHPQQAADNIELDHNDVATIQRHMVTAWAPHLMRKLDDSFWSVLNGCGIILAAEDGILAEQVPDESFVLAPFLELRARRVLRGYR